jgi:hypothetical protein
MPPFPVVLCWTWNPLLMVFGERQGKKTARHKGGYPLNSPQSPSSVGASWRRYRVNRVQPRSRGFGAICDSRAIRAEFRHSHYAGALNHVLEGAWFRSPRCTHLAIGEGIINGRVCVFGGAYGLVPRVHCTKAVAIKNMHSKRPMSFIIIGYLLAIRVLAVFALSLGTTSQLQKSLAR